MGQLPLQVKDTEMDTVISMRDVVGCREPNIATPHSLTVCRVEVEGTVLYNSATVLYCFREPLIPNHLYCDPVCVLNPILVKGLDARALDTIIVSDATFTWVAILQTPLERFCVDTLALEVILIS